MADRPERTATTKARKPAKWHCGGDVAKNLREWAKQIDADEMLAIATEYDRKNAIKNERRAAANRTARATTRRKVAQ